MRKLSVRNINESFQFLSALTASGLTAEWGSMAEKGHEVLSSFAQPTQKAPAPKLGLN